MPLDQSLVGHETTLETSTITVEQIRQFADAVGDANPLFQDQDAARAAGFPDVLTPPTFVTRFRAPFAAVGLDPEKMQVLHGEQEYTYQRPLHAGDSVTARHRVATLRQSARPGGMNIMTLEQLVDVAGAGQVGLGKATVIVRELAPDTPTSITAAKPQPEPAGERIPDLTKRVTQEQIDAYADVSGDHNPIHINPAAARAVGLDGTIAHGMLSMAFVAQLLTDWLATRPTPGGWVARLRVRFQGMTQPGDTLTCRGALGARDGGRQIVEVWIDNLRGERLTTGDADVVLPGE
jgi:acyl dehydratase